MSKLLRARANQLRKTKPRQVVRVGFDSTADNRNTANHWADANGQDLNTLIYGSRKAMVKRCTYEYRNNTYAKAIIDQLANHVVGRHGPTLQMQTENPEFNAEVEEKWQAFAKKLDSRGRQDLGAMLRTDIKETCVRGESLATQKSAKTTQQAPALRIMSISPDRLDSPMGDPMTADVQDGIKYDMDTGAPVAYSILKSNPNNMLLTPNLDVDWVPAEKMNHIFFEDEAEQGRGAPPLQAALPILAYLRRYTLATVAAAEQAANISGIVYTTLGQVDQDMISAMDEIEIPRNAMLTMPRGWQMDQMDAKHPTTQYKDFKAELVAEAARCVMMPYLVAAGNAAGYNYSSGRLDMQEFWSATEIIQDMLATRKCDWIFAAWLREGLMIPGYFQHANADIRRAPAETISHVWNWAGARHVDPQKEANAAQTRLESGLTTLAAEYGAQGKDWEREMEQRLREEAREKELREELGLTEEPEPEPEPETEPETEEETQEPERNSDELQSLRAEIEELQALRDEIKELKNQPELVPSMQRAELQALQEELEAVKQQRSAAASFAYQGGTIYRNEDGVCFHTVNGEIEQVPDGMVCIDDTGTHYEVIGGKMEEIKCH